MTLQTIRLGGIWNEIPEPDGVSARTVNRAEQQSGEVRNRLEQFFREREQRALQMARFSTHNQEDALDQVQDAMMKFVDRYSGRPEAEWGPLFHRVLQNGLIDWQRRRSFRDRFRYWLGESEQLEERHVTDSGHRRSDQLSPPDQLSNDRLGGAIEGALQALPLRQRQAFLLRNWEGFSVAETALAMGCGEGSVKTHLSRAVAKLRDQLALWQPQNDDGSGTT